MSPVLRHAVDPSRGAVRRPRKVLAAMLLVLLAPWFAAATEPGPLAPTADQAKLCAAIVRGLRQISYRKLPIDDALSGRALARYLDHLDPSHLFLLERDVKEFQRYGDRLDDAFLAGDLRPAYEIFNRFQMRRSSRLQALITWLDAGIDQLHFDGSDVVETDREQAAWPADLGQAEALWRARFKNDVLGLRLASRTDAEIADVLGKRYRDNLRRVEQVNSADVFGIYMNVLTSLFGPHTEYFPPHDAENFNINMSLTFQGIGALLGSDGEFCKVDRIIPGGPAERDGRLRAADRIIGVGEGNDGEMVDVVGWRNDEIVDLIRGPKGTVVRLSVLGAESSDRSTARTINLTRDEVQLEEQEAKKRIVERQRDGRTWRIGVIDLPAFYMDFDGARRGDADYVSSTRDVARLIEELKADKVDGIVFDLQGNGGGSLVEAHELTGLFLGECPVVQVRDAEGKVEVLGSERKTPLWDGPLVVLVDRLSASASEIFAAAIQDTGRGVIIGQRTFGKGTVQGLARIGDGGRLKVTQAKFYRVSGESTQHAAVAPDIDLPPLYDAEEIGESALDDALPWDRIDAVKHPHDDAVARTLPELRRRHATRVAGDAEFRYINERLRFGDDVAKRRELSLNEQQRRQEQKDAERQLLQMENQRRAAKGEAPIEKLEDAQPLADENEGPFVVEGAEILIDFVTLAHPAGRSF